MSYFDEDADAPDDPFDPLEEAHIQGQVNVDKGLDAALADDNERLGELVLAARAFAVFLHSHGVTKNTNVGLVVGTALGAALDVLE